MTSDLFHRCARALFLALVPVGLVTIATPADAQPSEAEPREIRGVRSSAERLGRDVAALEAALSKVRRGTDLSRCCARQIEAVAESGEALASSARPVRSRLARSRSRSAGKAGRELGVALTELRTEVDRLRKARDRESAGNAVGELVTLQASFGAILDLLADLWGTDEYAELVAPLNRCTELVKKVCGEENQCADAPTCPHAKQFLEMYNEATGEQERYDIEGQCIIALDDPVFAYCSAP